MNQCLCCVLAEIIAKKETLQSEFVERYLLAVAKQVCQNKQKGFDYVILCPNFERRIHTSPHLGNFVLRSFRLMNFYRR
jgi:hypothetical protein